jgi:hypothetical protein
LVYSHKMRKVLCVLWLMSVLPLAAAPSADAQKRKPKAPVTKLSAMKVSLDVTCAADLGKGVKSQRTFCDIAVGTDPASGIVMRVPPHSGPSTLRFDLHNRFTVAGPALSFARASALVAVLNGSNGVLIERAAVLSELRAELDLFDRIAGTGPGGSKTVAPGRAEAVKITLPAAVTSISIVGVRLELTDKSGRSEYATPGRPVAIGSNFRIEYTPATVSKQ